MDFIGLSVFAITPSNADGLVEAKDFSRIIERICTSKADSIGVLGSTGGFAYLDQAQRCRALEIAVQTSAGALPVIAGIGALRSDAVVALAKDAAAAGVDALLLPPVSYTPLRDEEVYALYCEVAAVSDLPICIYHNPGTTHFSFSTSLIVQLSKLEAIRAIKQPPPAEQTIAKALAELRAATGGELRIGYSSDSCLTAALHSGADCFFSALGGILPESFVKLATVAQTGTPSDRHASEAKFEALWVLLKKFGGLRLSFAIANRLGITQAQPPGPILPLSEADLVELDAAVAQLS
jgi:4-hydroxy-tetrahydrodipicolinate synthase